MTSGGSGVQNQLKQLLTMAKERTKRPQCEGDMLEGLSETGKSSTGDALLLELIKEMREDRKSEEIHRRKEEEAKEERRREDEKEREKRW